LKLSIVAKTALRTPALPAPTTLTASANGAVELGKDKTRDSGTKKKSSKHTASKSPKPLREVLYRKSFIASRKMYAKLAHKVNDT
jgi:hypothetical protein